MTGPLEPMPPLTPREVMYLRRQGLPWLAAPDAEEMERIVGPWDTGELDAIHPGAGKDWKAPR